AALYGGLHLELAVLDLSHQLPGQIGVDALAQLDRLAQRVAGRLLRFLVIERARLDLASGQVNLQELMQLLELQLVVGEQRDLAFLALDRALAALEVEAGGDLAADAGDRIID